MVILITGAAGSLGKALVKTVIEGYPHSRVIAVDNNEWAFAELKNMEGNIVGHFGDYANLDLFDFASVTHCIHAAAYKHQPLGEQYPHAFIENNINGTAKLFNHLSNIGVKTCFISTDKAVEPCSLYGYTKAIGEYLAKFHGFSIARLGNILHSSGSVIPVWEDAIAKGLPIPITDWNMERYFIDVDMAAKCIIEKFRLGEKLIIPDMGEPVSLKQLLRMTLDKHGIFSVESYEPGYTIIGVRPREKMVEKLTWEGEYATA